MDKKFLTENGLLTAQQRFKKLNEYTYLGSDDLTNEDESDDNNDINLDNNDDNNISNNDPSNGNEQESLNDIPNIGDNNGNDNSELPSKNGVEGLDVSDSTEDDNEDEEVIDVDDLTKSQEKTEDKVDDLDDKFNKIFKAVSDFDALLSKNNQMIDNLKAEIERRNPTQLEKMGLQAQNSYPFNLTPTQYWDNKEKTSNYRVDDDDNGINQGQYVITKNDVDGNVDWNSISKSLDDDELHQNIKTIFNY